MWNVSLDWPAPTGIVLSWPAQNFGPLMRRRETLPREATMFARSMLSGLSLPALENHPVQDAQVGQGFVGKFWRGDEDVAWVERSDTHQLGFTQGDGFREGLYPSYELSGRLAATAKYRSLF
jgi:hypothetical protein